MGGETFLGFIIVHEQKHVCPLSLCVDYMAVELVHRWRGYGRFMFWHVLQMCLNRKIPKIKLCCHWKDVPFYRALGFQGEADAPDLCKESDYLSVEVSHAAVAVTS